MNIKEQCFTRLFDKWWNQQVERYPVLFIRQTKEIPKLFLNEDAGKTAESDSIMEEYRFQTHIEKENLSDYLEKRFEEEIDFEGITNLKDFDEADIFEYFDIWYDDWTDKQIQNLSQNMELEC